MPLDKDKARLLHMLSHAHEAVAFAAHRSRADLNTDRMLSLALVRLLEIVGEAAAHVSDATKAAAPTVPWNSIIGLRNRLVHGYDDVDLDILWTIVTKDLPPLIRELDAVIIRNSAP